MNSALAVHLWKEWREQRAALLQAVAILAVVFVAMAALLPDSLRQDPIVRSVAALIPLLVVCGTIVPDLLAREHETGAVVFLARTPGGLRGAWIAKFAVAIAVALAAWSCGAFATELFLGRSVAVDAAPWTAASQPLLSVALITLVAWTFAVSAWLSNRFLALPCAAMFTAATIAPLVSGSSGLAHLRIADAYFVFVPLGAAIGLVSSWFAFVRGPRGGRSRRWITNVGFAGCLTGLLPSAAPAAYRTAFPARQHSLEPVAITDDGEFLFHHVVRFESSDTDDLVRLVHVDLRTREIRTEDAKMAFTRVPPARHASPWIYRGLKPVIGDATDAPQWIRSIDAVPVEDGHPGPADFGRADVGSRFSVDCVGAGHLLSVHRGDSEQQHYRDRAGRHEFGQEDLRALAPDLAVEAAVVTTGDAWLVRDDRRAWWWLDLRTGEHEPCDALVRDSEVGWSFGPSTVGGALIAVDEDGLKRIDTDTREWCVVAGGEDVLRMNCVLDDRACSLLANDSSVWLRVAVGRSLDDRRQAAILVDITNASVTERVVVDDPRACLLAAGQDGLLYQLRWGGDLRWYDVDTGESRTLVRARP